MILVTGSTGLVGRHLVLALAQAGKQVRALYRSEKKKKEVEDFYAFAKAQQHSLHIDWQLGDITDVPHLQHNFKGITHVYHCAALISFDPYDFKKLTKVNREGTANIVNLCISERAKKLVHLSSIATLASFPNNPATEENYWNPDADNSVYALTKYGAEMEVWRGTQEGLDAVIFNPGIILGEGNYTDGSGTLYKHILEEKSYYPKGSSAVIDVKDLVHLMIQGMESEVTGERFIAVTENTSYQNLFRAIATSIKKNPPRKAIQNWWLLPILCIDTIAGWIIKKRRITKSGFISLQSEKNYSNKKVVKALDYTPIPVEDTLLRIARHLRWSQSSG